MVYMQIVCAHVRVYTHTHLLTLSSGDLVDVKDEMPLLSHLGHECTVAAALCIQILDS